MTAVTVSTELNGNVTAHWTFSPIATEDTSTGTGISVPGIVRGWANSEGDGTIIANTLSVSLDNAYLWDVDINLRNAPPIRFYGFNPGSGGDLLELLSAQGWTSA